MERIFRSNNIVVNILFAFSCAFLLIGGQGGFHAFKPEKDFQYLADNEAKTGLHIKGELSLALDCFAKDDKVLYYVVPVKNGYMALKVYEAEQAKMEALLEETKEYYTAGTEITTTVPIDGYTLKLSPRLEQYLVRYLRSIGCTDSEIEEMRPFVLLNQSEMGQMRIFFLLGVGFLLLSIAVWIVCYIREGKKEKKLLEQYPYYMMSEVGICEKLGKKLTESRASRGKIVMKTIVNIIGLLLFLLIWALSILTFQGLGMGMIVWVLLAIAIGMLPLRHWNECMEFYENGFSFSGKAWLYDQVGMPQFYRYETRGSSVYICKNYMTVKGTRIDVTYLSKVVRQYHRAYKAAEDASNVTITYYR